MREEQIKSRWFFYSFQRFFVLARSTSAKNTTFCTVCGTQKSWTWKYLENILLLISISFTPKTSHSCLNRRHFFHKSEDVSTMRRSWGPKRLKFRMRRKKNSLHLLVASSPFPKTSKIFGVDFSTQFPGCKHLPI